MSAFVPIVDCCLLPIRPESGRGGRIGRSLLSGVLGHSGCFASLPRRNRVYDSFFPLVRSQGKALADMLCTLTGAVLQIAASLGHTYGIAFRYLPAEVDLLCKFVSKLCGGETAGPRQSQ